MPVVEPGDADVLPVELETSSEVSVVDPELPLVLVEPCVSTGGVVTANDVTSSGLRVQPMRRHRALARVAVVTCLLTTRTIARTGEFAPGPESWNVLPAVDAWDPQLSRHPSGCQIEYRRRMQRPRDITMRFLAEPSSVNFGGKVHGGAVMTWIDQAGYACAVGWSGHYCVTRYVGGIRFHRPIVIGHVVEVWARVIYTGTTSMHIAVDVRSADPRDGHYAQTTHCVIIFVAIDDAGTPVAVPPWDPQTDDDRAQVAYAKRLMALRKGIEEEMDAARQRETGANT